MQFPKILNLTRNVNALLCEKDKQALYRYASKVPRGGVIVDIGTAAGGSAFIMALASKPSVKVVTIDPAVNENFLSNRKDLGLVKKISFRNKTSNDAVKNWHGGKIDMLFVDGIHNYEGVMNDIDTWGSFVKKGGTVAIHDIFLYDNTIGKAVQDLVGAKRLKPIEIVDDKWQDERRIGMFIGRQP